ncbi:hypothetical protein ACS0TY_022716 [Phlomoides rotata]
MYSDFRHTCQVETRKIMLLLGLVFASVLIIQYFEVPYKDRMLSFLSSGKTFFNVSDANRVQNLGAFSPKTSPSDVSSLENTTNMDHSSDLDEMMIVRSISIAPQNAITSSTSPYIAQSPTLSVANISPSSTVLNDSDSLIFGPTSSVVVSFAPAPSPMPAPRMVAFSPLASANEKPKSVNPPLKDAVVSISEMHDLLLHSRASSFSKSPLWPSSVDQELLDARFKIENAAMITNRPGLYSPIFRNLSRFVRSYELMEEKLKVYVYGEGKRPVFHQPRLKGIYASEGWFMKNMKASNQFITNNAEEAHLFYLPFSSQMLASYVYVPNSHSFDRILEFLRKYIDTIKTRHNSWNRTDGADHFIVGCHDWASYETRHVMPSCIRALCNSDVKEGFQFGKDVSLPETNVPSPQKPMQEIGGNPPSARKILAFFAGQMHGYVRPILLKHWENKDPDIKIVGKMRKGYTWHMKNSKYCICAKGYEVNSPRVVEAIMYGCVPVIISDNFVPPFFEILNWESFAVFVLEKDIPDLKNVLLSISERRYGVMQKRVKQVGQHFIWHNTPIKYDIFHMILHSIWYNRVFRMAPKSK